MGFRQLLMEHGIIEDADAPEREPAHRNQQDDLPTYGRKAAAATPVVVTTRVPTGTADPAYVDELRKSLEESQVSGYQEFSAQLKIFESVAGMDEATRFRAALASLTGNSGLKKGDIVNSVENRLALLTSKQQEFTNTINDRRKEKLGSKESEKQAAQKQIEALRAQITTLEERVKQIDAESQTAEQRLSQASVSFAAAYALVETDLKSFLDKITNYLS
jgi:polyhydroxyalkanoate synthesis regulator phasin